jgi:hypothetical protein
MNRAGLQPVLLRGNRPPLAAGWVATVALVAICTGLIYPLKSVTTVSALGVVYLLGVLVIDTFWGRSLALVMAVLSAVAGHRGDPVDLSGIPRLVDHRDQIAVFGGVRVGIGAVKSVSNAHCVSAPVKAIHFTSR